MSQKTTLACQCGRFHITLEGSPFITTECHCKSCRAAGTRLATLPLAFPLQDDNGGTPFILFRKDRVSFPDGTDLLEAHRLSDDATTRRVVTTCCKSPVFLEFKGAHWLSLYAGLWPDHARPAIEIRTMVSDLPERKNPDSALPASGLVTTGFYAKLLAAWIAMGFKTPSVEVADAKP